MSALPAEHQADPLEPQRILRELPDRERANFLTACREALDGARDPAGWGQLFHPSQNRREAIGFLRLRLPGGRAVAFAMSRIGVARERRGGGWRAGVPRRHDRRDIQAAAAAPRRAGRACAPPGGESEDRDDRPGHQRAPPAR